jgi:hypothetical protein
MKLCQQKDKYQAITLKIFSLSIILTIHFMCTDNFTSLLLNLFSICYVRNNCKVSTGIVTHSIAHTIYVTLATVHAQLTHLGSL